MIEGAAQGDHGVDIADEDATRRFFARVQSYRDAVERRRFGGENPDVQPARRRPQPVETAAAAIAAERLHGVLNLNGERVSTGEDLAVGQLDAALRALATWDFTLASQCLDTAAALARVPRIQQQVSLVRGLAGVAGAVFYRRPAPKPDNRRAARDLGDLVRSFAEDLLARLDLLDAAEKDFYAAEARRLAGLGRGMDDDDLLWTAWALVRARTALRCTDKEGGLAWLLRAYTRNAARLDGDDTTLRAAVDGAAAAFRLLLTADGEEREALERQATAVRPYDVMTVLVVALSRAYGADLTEVGNRFAIMIYRSPALVEGAHT